MFFHIAFRVWEIGEALDSKEKTTEIVWKKILLLFEK